MEHDALIRRLKAMAEQPLDEATAVAHLDRAGAVRTRSWRSGRVAVVAACALVLAAPAAALTIAASSDDAPKGTTDLSEAPAAVPVQQDDECTGPPPFAGQTPAGDTEEERDANRQAEADAFEDARAACPEEPDDDGDDLDTDLNGEGAGSECSGPPPFADTPAEPADPANGVVPSPRAAEAKAHAEARAACRAETGATDDDASRTPEDEREAAGPPDGPPEGTPDGRPEAAADGPPEGTPGGPPEGTPDGPPEGTSPGSEPAGAAGSADTPDGPPDGAGAPGTAG